MLKKRSLAIVAALSNVVRDAHRDHAGKSAHGMNEPPRISDHPSVPAAPVKSRRLSEGKQYIAISMGSSLFAFALDP
ncbi:MAG: hypothetical protein WD733_26095 [Bryobacterales bacterium]